MSTDHLNTERIRALNDKLRCSGVGGEVHITRGIRRHGADFVRSAREAVRLYTDFLPGDDPEGTHEFGAITVASKPVYWVINYYEKGNHPYLSPNPADPKVTDRALTILLPSEW